jgi:hypothetical protein
VYEKELNMRCRSTGILCTTWLLTLLLSLTWAQETVQEALWVVPDGKLPDLSQTFTAGTTLALSWNSYTSPSYIDASKTLVDLWVTAFDSNVNSFNQLLTGRDSDGETPLFTLHSTKALELC